jgi:hypothetical protein
MVELNKLLDIPSTVYHSYKALSNTGISKILECPAKYKYWQDNQNDQTEAMLFGSLFHMMILEPEKVKDTYTVFQFPGNIKAGKQEREDALINNRIGIKADTFDVAATMTESVFSHPAIGESLMCDSGLNEVSIFWEEEVGGAVVPCKARLDRVLPKSTGVVTVYDIKTATSSNPADLPNVFHNRGYHRQQHWYTRALAQCGLEVDYFCFVFVEKEPPYLTTPATLSAEDVLTATNQCNRALAVYAICQDSGIWPDYSRGRVVYSALPGWSKKQFVDTLEVDNV